MCEAWFYAEAIADRVCRGARYHVMSRGDRREAIFHDDADRQEFLRTLGQACLKAGWQVHAYCLMKNHFHLVAQTHRSNLRRWMHWLLVSYGVYFNRRHQDPISFTEMFMFDPDSASRANPNPPKAAPTQRRASNFREQAMD